MSFDHYGVARRGAVLLVAAGALITAAGCSPANDASTPPETHVTWPASDDSAVTFAIERWAVDSRSPTEYVVTGRREKAGDDALRVILSRSSAGSIHARFEQPERAELVIGVDGRVAGEASILALLREVRPDASGGMAAVSVFGVGILAMTERASG